MASKHNVKQQTDELNTNAARYVVMSHSMEEATYYQRLNWTAKHDWEFTIKQYDTADANGVLSTISITTTL